MFKSFHKKQYLSLAVLSAALCSMTLAAAPFGTQAGENAQPDYDVAGSSEAVSGAGSRQVKPFIAEELEELVAPVALYPDELLAIVLPAAAYPLQIVQAARFLEELKKDDSLQPDEAWDESIVALLNYPEVIELLNNDLEWTWKLGEAVLNQESEVIEAVEAFRDRAMLAGNLATDEHQPVNNDGGTIEIIPADPEVIYVPYYEPRQVVVYQPYPVYHYYPNPYPVYYYPYPVGYHFSAGFFWGITTAFTIGWHSHHLNVHLWSYYSHPYYGHTYYRRNHYYHNPYQRDRIHRQARSGRHDGDHRWQPGRRHGSRPVYRGPVNDRHGNNNIIASSRHSRLQQAGTFKPRPELQTKMVSSTNTLSGSAARKTRSGTPPTLKRDATRPGSRDETREQPATLRTNYVSQERKSSSKTQRNSLDWERGRQVSKPDRSPAVRTSRPDPATGNRSRVKATSPAVRTSRSSPATRNQSQVRATSPTTYSGSREARPSPQPRQSQRTVSRSPQSRPAPTVHKQSPAPRSDRQRSKSNDSRGKVHQDNRVRSR